MVMQFSSLATKDRFSAIQDWLLKEAPLIGDFSTILDQFIHRLHASSVPIQRFFLGIRTIHPQIAASAFVWNNIDGLKEITRDHSVMRSSAFKDSPLYQLYEKGETFIRCRIVDDHPSSGKVNAVEPPRLDFPILDDLKKEGATDYMVMALPLRSGIKASLSLAINRPEGFSEEEVQGIRNLVPILSLLTDCHATTRNAETLLNVYLGRNAGRRVLDGHVERGEGITIAAAIWFCDLRNFTAMSSIQPRHEVIATLNDYFEAMGRPVESHGGEILKFIGDAMLAIFPMQDDMDRDRACRSALDAALEGLANLRDLNDLRASLGKNRLKAGIGLHAGSVTYGNIGTTDRLDFTVIGPAVNLASRLEGMCRPLGESLLASKTFASPCGFKLASLGTFELPGIEEKQEIFGLPR